MKRLLVGVGCAAALMLLLPSFVSRTAITSSSPFPSQAFAGHSMANGFVECTCGAVDCICDPGEAPVTLKAAANQSNTSVSNKGLTGQPTAPGTEPGLAALILALLFAVLLRMR